MDNHRGPFTQWNKPIVTLKRTFNQPIGDGTVIKFWRIIGPADHANLNSDLSVQGLKEWGIIK